MKKFDVVIIGENPQSFRLAKELSAKKQSVALVYLDEEATTYFEDLISLLTQNSPFPSKKEILPDSVAVYHGRPLFKEKSRTVQVGGEDLEARAFVLAMGAKPFIPPFPGLTNVPFDTPLSYLKKASTPPSATIVGAGPVGVILAEQLTRAGKKITLLMNKDRILPKEELEISHFYTTLLTEAGVQIKSFDLMNAIRLDEDKKIMIHAEKRGSRLELETEAIIGATGLRPNSQGFGLETKNIYCDISGRVVVNDLMQTSHGRVWAFGPVTGPPFHLGLTDHQVNLLTNNLSAPFFSQMRLENDFFPSTIPASVSLAKWGYSQTEAEQEYKDVKVSVLDKGNKGLLKLIGRRKGGDILGVHLVAPQAEDMILFFDLAGRAGLTFFDLLDRQHYPSPSYGDLIFDGLAAWVEKN